MQRLQTLTKPQTGVELAPTIGLFGIFSPSLSNNELAFGNEPNPNVDPVAALAGTIMTLVGNAGRRDPYALRIGNGSGFGVEGFLLSFTAYAGRTYTFSLDMVSTSGGEFEIVVRNGVTNAIVATKAFVATGYWQRDDCWVTFTSTISFTHHFTIRRTDSNNGDWYADGLQFEESAFPTSWIHPEQNAAYYPGEAKSFWRASPTTGNAESVRPVLARSGGRLVRFADLGFRVTGFRGLGLMAPDHIITPHALLPGGYFQRAKYGTREFQVVGQFVTENLQELQRQRDMLIWSMIDYDLFAQDPLILRYQGCDRNGCAYGREFDIYCRYAGGLEGNIQSILGEEVVLRFRSENPFVYEPGDFGTKVSAVGAGIETVTMDILSPASAPSFGWIRMSGRSGRLLKIENTTTGQVITLDHSLAPIAGSPEYIQFASEYVYYKEKAVRVYGNVNYDPLTDPSLFISEEISYKLDPGGDLPIWYAAPRTPHYNGLQQVVFTFDPTIACDIPDIFCQYVRTHFSVDSADSYYDF